MKVAISRQKEDMYEVREFDLTKGLPHFHGLRILYVKITHDDVRNGRGQPHFRAWLEDMIVRFIQ